MTFEETSRKITVKKDEIVVGWIELSLLEKSFTSYGTRKFLEAELNEIKDYMTAHSYV